MSAVHSPSHYKRGGVELADAIDAFELGRWEAQAAQYLFRARHKDAGAHEAQDLEKAVWFTLRRLKAIDPARLTSFVAKLAADVEPENVWRSLVRDEITDPAEIARLEATRLADVALSYNGRRWADPVHEINDVRHNADLADVEPDASVWTALTDLPAGWAIVGALLAASKFASSTAGASKRLVPREVEQTPPPPDDDERRVLDAVTVKDVFDAFPLAFVTDRMPDALTALNSCRERFGAAPARMTDTVSFALAPLSTGIWFTKAMRRVARDVYADFVRHASGDADAAALERGS